MTAEETGPTGVVDVPQLLDMSEEELDTLFTRSPAGPIPNGECDGTVIAAPGTELTELAAKMAYALAWKGKVFDGEKGTLENRITPFDLHAIAARVYRGESWFDQKECIVLDYSKTSLLAKRVRDEIREVAPGLYLGLVFWERTRILYFALRVEG